MSNHAGQYFMPGRSCRMPARRRLSGDARLLARLAAACRAVWQALLVRAQAPLAHLARAAWRWRAGETRPGSYVAGRAAGCTASSVKCSLAQQRTPCKQQLAPQRARQQAVSGAIFLRLPPHCPTPCKPSQALDAGGGAHMRQTPHAGPRRRPLGSGPPGPRLALSPGSARTAQGPRAGRRAAVSATCTPCPVWRASSRVRTHTHAHSACMSRWVGMHGDRHCEACARVGTCHTVGKWRMHCKAWAGDSLRVTPAASEQQHGGGPGGARKDGADVCERVGNGRRARALPVAAVVVHAQVTPEVFGNLAARAHARRGVSALLRWSKAVPGTEGFARSCCRLLTPHPAVHATSTMCFQQSNNPAANARITLALHTFVH